MTLTTDTKPVDAPPLIIQAERSVSEPKEGFFNGRQVNYFDDSVLFSSTGALSVGIISVAIAILGIAALNFSLILSLSMLGAGLGGLLISGYIIRFGPEDEEYRVTRFYNPQFNPYIARSEEGGESPFIFLCKPSPAAIRRERNQHDFDKLIKRYFEIKPSKGDGNCLFHSLAHFFPDRTHDAIRREVCDFMAQHEDHFKDFIPGDFKEYVANMRNESWYKPTVWGDNPELVAFVGVQAQRGQYIQLNIFCSAEELPTEVDGTLRPNIVRGSDAREDAGGLIIGPGIKSGLDKPPLIPDPPPEAVVRRVDLLRTGENHYSALFLREVPLAPDAVPPSPIVSEKRISTLSEVSADTSLSTTSAPSLLITTSATPVVIEEAIKAEEALRAAAQQAADQLARLSDTPIPLSKPEEAKPL